MWLVLRHKRGELKILQEEIKKNRNLPEFSFKIKFTKVINNKTKEISHNFLSDYVFFYDNQFIERYYKFYKKFTWIKNFTVKLLIYQKM